jgi:hypothetical protein
MKDSVERITSTPMVSSNFEIVVFTGFSSNPVAVASAARRAGYVTRFITVSRDELDLSQFQRPLLFVEIDGNSDDVRRRITELAQFTSLQPFPVAVVGEGASQFANLLKNFFPRSTVVQSPFGDNDIVRAIKTLLELPPSGENRGLAVRRVSKPDTTSISVKPDLRESLNLFQKLSGFSSLKRYSFGGRELVQASSVEKLPTQQFMPENPELVADFKKVIESASSWARAHHHRVAYTSSKLSGPFGVASSHVQDGRQAALAYSIAAHTLASPILRDPLHLESCNEIRMRMSDVLERAAQKSQSDPQLKGAARILEAASLIMRSEPKSEEENDVAVLAGSLVASDFVNRACWGSGTWNQQGAYSLFVKCRENSLHLESDDVKAALVRLLLETAEAGVPRKLVHHDLSTNFALISLAKNQHIVPIHANERRLTLSELMPGLRLSRPLVAFDGKTICEQDIELDQDLVWRVWSLAMIRPVNTPLFAWVAGGA